MIRVIAAVIERDGKVLIGKRRSDEEHSPNKWEFPGGKKENEENDEECLVRELLEECEVNINVCSLISSNIFKYKELEVSLFLYHCECESTDIVSNAHDEMKWISLKELYQYDLLEANVPLVPAIQNYFI